MASAAILAVGVNRVWDLCATGEMGIPSNPDFPCDNPPQKKNTNTSMNKKERHTHRPEFAFVD